MLIFLFFQPGEGFLEALTQDRKAFLFLMSPTFDKASLLICVIDVECVSKEILNFTEKGIVSVDGKEREFDIIVCATGFDVAFAPHLYVADLPMVCHRGKYLLVLF